MIRNLSWTSERVTSGTMDRLIVAIRTPGVRQNGLDALGFPGLPDDHIEEERLVNDHLKSILDGQSEKYSRKALEIIASTSYAVEELSLAMLRTTGMDAAILLALAYILSVDDQGNQANLRIPDFFAPRGPMRGEKIRVSAEHSGKIAIHVPITQDVFWGDDGMISVRRPFPESVCMALKGRPLIDVIDHPVLTPLNLRVTEAYPTVTKSTSIQTNHLKKWILLKDLGYEQTRPDAKAFH